MIVKSLKVDSETKDNRSITFLTVLFDDGSGKYIAIGEPYTKEVLISALRNLAAALETK